MQFLRIGPRKIRTNLPDWHKNYDSNFVLKFRGRPADKDPMTEKQAFEAILWVYHDRLRDTLTHLSGNGSSSFSDFSIASTWPLKGALRFTRDADGQRYSLTMAWNRWRANRIK